MQSNSISVDLPTSIYYTTNATDSAQSVSILGTIEIYEYSLRQDFSSILLRLKSREVHMPMGYEINDLAKEESWRIFRFIGELVGGFDKLSGIEPAVTIYGSARIKPGEELYEQTAHIARRLGELGFSIITGGGPGVMEAANKGAKEAGVTSVGLNIQLPEEQCRQPVCHQVHYL